MADRRAEKDHVHVIPKDDLTEHEITEDCVCGPTLDPVKRGDGSIGWVVIHHSLDGREADEVPRCQHVSATPWGASQCALADGHDGRHAYDPGEGAIA